MPWSGITHQHLITLMVRLPTDFEPDGERNRDDQFGTDCSCGCKWFAPLEGKLSIDWGVCTNPASPRVGLLTFEHQGCWQYEEDPESAERVERLRAANADSIKGTLKPEPPEGQQ
jgi:hypothetical protein